MVGVAHFFKGAEEKGNLATRERSKRAPYSYPSPTVSRHAEGRIFLLSDPSAGSLGALALPLRA